MRQLLQNLLFGLCLTIPVFAQNGNGESTAVVTPETLKADIDAVPCNNNDRLDGVFDLFTKYGVPKEFLKVESYKNVENLVVKLPGKSAETIIIGAHYDLAGEGSCGAIDNWTGIVTLAHLYRTFKAMPQLDKTLLFVAFGKEEEHLVGSRAMADAINKRKENNNYCAMVNIDSLGLVAPQVFENVSSKELGALAEETAKQIGAPLSRIQIQGADTDSTPFLMRKIPALSLVALPRNWSMVFHTKSDQAKHVNANHVYDGYRIAHALISKINDSVCNAFREGKKK